MTEIIADIFSRVPALGSLRGLARIEAEQALENAIADAIDRYCDEAEMAAEEDA